MQARLRKPPMSPPPPHLFAAWGHSCDDVGKSLLSQQSNLFPPCTQRTGAAWNQLHLRHPGSTGGDEGLGLTEKRAGGIISHMSSHYLLS